MDARSFRAGVLAALALLVTLLLAAPATAAPANDNIAGAQVLPAALPSTTPATSIGATGEPGETVFSNPATESVWFAWTPSASTTAIVDLCNSGFSGGSPTFGIGVYTGGTTWATLTEVVDTAGPCKLSFSATAGTTYKIQVDFLRAEGNFTLTLRKPQPPANDNFASAQNLGNALPFSVPGSTIDATSGEAGEPPLGSSARTVWYSWTAPVTGHVQLGGCPFETQPGSAANKTLVVYTGATLATLSKVAETTNCKMEFDVAAGTNYKIVFSGSVSGEGTFTLSMVSATPPANDNLAAAAVVGPALPFSVPGDNSFATLEPEENKLQISEISSPSHSVWYRWTPAVSQRVKLNACSDSLRPRLGVFTGNTITTLVKATEPQSGSPYCAVELNAVAGTTYKIAIAGGPFEGQHGAFTLSAHAVSRPANDDLAGAIPIGPGLPIAVDGSNADATVEKGEARPVFETSPLGTVWYRWGSGFSGPVDISTCGSATSVIAAVHTGATFGTMTRIVPAGEALPGSCGQGVKGSSERFVATAGTTYFVQVSARGKDIEGSFRLTITDPNAQPPTPQPAVPPAAATVAAVGKVPIDPLANCRMRYRGKGRVAKAKRARCIAKVKRRAAIARCHKLSGARERKCIAATRKHYAVKPAAKGKRSG